MAAAVKIADAEGAKFWADQFKDQDKVPNKDFATKLHGSIPNAPSVASVENVVNFIVDSADQDGHVSKKEFDFFLSRFGPFATAVQKTQKNLFMPNGSLVPWFFGCAPREKADAAFSKDGQFLLRFSERYPTKLTISFAKFDPATKKGNHRHILVENCSEGYKLEGTAANPNGQVFPSIPELLRLQGSYEGAESDIYRRFVSTVKLETQSAHNAYQSIDALAADHKASGGGGSHYSDFETVSSGVHKSASSSSGHYSDFETTVGGGGHHGGGGAYAPIDELAGKGHFKKPQQGGGNHYEAFDDQGADFTPAKPKAQAKPAGNHYEAFDEEEDLAAKK